MALKKADLYSSLWANCDQLRGGMDVSQYKDYILTLFFVKYVSDKAKSGPNSLIDVVQGGSFDDMLAAKEPCTAARCRHEGACSHALGHLQRKAVASRHGRAAGHRAGCA